jgi:hypothetical protein
MPKNIPGHPLTCTHVGVLTLFEIKCVEYASITLFIGMVVVPFYIKDLVWTSIILPFMGRNLENQKKVMPIQMVNSVAIIRIV